MKFLQSFQRSIARHSSVSGFEKNQLLLDISIVLTFWAILFFLGYPDPHQDDLFFVGAGINLARGGEFVNPLLENFNKLFASEKYYYHLPYYSYIIAFWLKLFGISAKSFSLYQILNGIVFSISTNLILQGFRFQKFLYVPIVILFAIWMNFFGLRPDSTGLAFLSLGLLFLTKDKTVYYFLGFFFVIASFLSSTLVYIAYGISFTIGIFLIKYFRSSRSGLRTIALIKTILPCLVFAIIVHSLIFLVLIEFNINSFLTAFLLHSSMRRVSTLQGISFFFKKTIDNQGVFLVLPSYLLFLILCIGYFINYRKHSIVRTILLVSLVFGVVLNILIYSGAYDLCRFFILIGDVCLASQIPFLSLMKRIILLFSLGIILISQSWYFIPLIARTNRPMTYFSGIKKEVAQMAQPKKYVIDTAAAKFVFDYDIPKNSIGWENMRIDRERPSLSDKKANDLWIISKTELEKWNPEFRGDSYPKITLFNRKFNSLAKDPFEIIILR